MRNVKSRSVARAREYSAAHLAERESARAAAEHDLVPVLEKRPLGAVLEVEIEVPVAFGPEVRKRLGVLRGPGDPGVLERVERGDPGGDRGRERLAQERAERLVFPGLDVARAPVVDEDDAEDMLAERGRADRLTEFAGQADHEAELELDVEPRGRAERRLGSVGRLPLSPRPPNRGCAGHDGSGPAVVADG